jgi:4-methyl-5(b-hydroxyethyl)-thiazole monophosphate biosynthesis
MAAIRYAYEQGKFVAAICAAPTILAQLHITDGIPAVCYPGCEEQMGNAQMMEKACIRHDNIITGTSAGCAVPFGLELIRVLRGDDAAQLIANQIVIR